MVHHHNSRMASLTYLGLLCLAGCEGCPQAQSLITITYEQVGACNGYQQTTGPGGSGPQQTVSAGPNASFVAFRILTLDNSKTNQDFVFDPDLLYLSSSSPTAYMDSSLSLYQDLGVFTAVKTTVPKGKSQGNSGIVVGVVSGEAPESNNTNFTLLYDTPAGHPGVVLVKKNPEQTTWPQTNDCTAIQF